MSLNDQLEFKLLTKDRVQEALNVQAVTMKQECLATGLGMFEDPGAPEEMNLVFAEIIKDGATLIAVDRETNRVAAVAFNKLRARPRQGVKDHLESFIEQKLKHRSCKELVTFLDDIEIKVDIFEKYNANGAMELFYLGTDPRYQGRRIAHQMVQKSVELARGFLEGTTKRNSINGDIMNEHVLPEIVYGVFASNYSQRIANTLGFEVLHEVRYEDFTFAGRRMSERIGDVHKSAKLQALRL